MRLSGWGNYPVIESQRLELDRQNRMQDYLAQGRKGICHAMGRSYGDSALAETIFATNGLKYILAFDELHGRVRCQAGVTLSDLLAVFVPRGWFLPVTPGTRFVSVGGAIASDVHGKNHHHDGCFSALVRSFKLLLPEGQLVECSQQLNSELFRATCGGMGLTGVILEAELQLRPIHSAYMEEVTRIASNLNHVLDLFDTHHDATYSVAWIDCMTRGRNMGRSLLMLGEHSRDGELELTRKKPRSVPFDIPGILLSRYSIAAFNELYYRRVRQDGLQRKVHYETYFYPLDGLLHWNRLYGRNGFVQYQFVIPKERGREGLHKIMEAIACSKRGSFLAVLKLLGEANDNLLSFPMTGYTLALDFKMDDGLLPFLEKLDQLVLDFGGRLYLTKDARMSRMMFQQGYPRWQTFVDIRQRLGAADTFNSLQSQRLGI